MAPMIDLFHAARNDIISIIGGLSIGFALGSIPSGYLLVRLKTGADVRQTGSGNIGATNVSRALGVGGGVITLFLDAAKGAAGTFVAAYVGVAVLGKLQPVWAAAGALGAVLGHCYTPWLGLRGGKGVATLLGAFGLLVPVPTAVGAGVLVATAAAGRMMSLASLLGSMALVVTAWLRDEHSYSVAAALLAAIVIVWRHRENIRRITRGEEAKLGGARS